jgi:hypothetical protein
MLLQAIGEARFRHLVQDMPVGFFLNQTEPDARIRTVGGIAPA